MPCVPVLVFVFVLLVVPVVFPGGLGGASLSGSLRVDALEDTTFFHRMVRLGMKLARPFQDFVVIFLVVSSSIGMLDCVHLMINVARSLASEIIMVVVVPIPPFSVFVVVATSRVSVVKTSMLGRLFILLGSSHVFVDGS